MYSETDCHQWKGFVISVRILPHIRSQFHNLLLQYSYHFNTPKIFKIIVKPRPPSSSSKFSFKRHTIIITKYKSFILITNHGKL